MNKNNVLNIVTEDSRGAIPLPRERDSTLALSLWHVTKFRFRDAEGNHFIGTTSTFLGGSGGSTRWNQFGEQNGRVLENSNPEEDGVSCADLPHANF